MSAAPIGYRPVATLDDTARGEFIIRVYQQLLVAVGAFIAFEALLITLGVAEAMWDFFASSGAAWLLLLGGFMVVNWMATTAAHDVLDPSRQYAGLFGMAAAQALIFAPFLHYFLRVRTDDGASLVVAAAIITVAGFAGLSA